MDPRTCRDDVVDDLHAREVNGVIRLPPLRVGQTVRIVRGSLRGRLAVYDGMSGRDRDRVLLTLSVARTPSLRIGDAIAH